MKTLTLKFEKFGKFFYHGCRQTRNTKEKEDWSILFYMTKALQEAIMKRTQLKQNIPKLKLKKAMLHLN